MGVKSMKEELKKLVERFAADIDFYKDRSKKYNEHSTRVEFIDPFFELLGWDIRNAAGKSPRLKEVKTEDYSKENNARPDYTFTLSGVDKFFVEAKKPSVHIEVEPDPAYQARSYGWSANHQIVVLTNFEYLSIYDCGFPPERGEHVNISIIKRYHFTEYLSHWEEIYELLSKETVYSGEFDKTFQKLTEKSSKMPVDKYFLEQINTWRIKLANHIQSKHPDYPLDYLNDVIQKFINQIIFLRMCEDRNLPLYENLKDTLLDPVNELTKIFKEADKKYNSGLFNGEHIVFDLNNDIIMDIVKTLYKPYPYSFNVIEANVLGEIYELFLSKRLAYSEAGNIILKDKDENLNRDVVSTPIEIVRYMVDKSVKPLCEGKTPEEILELKIADIASGSGIYLIEIYNYLIQYCVSWYQKYRPEHLITVDGGKTKLPFVEKRNLLLSCLYGNDIDPNAVEVTKFNLLLKLLEDETIPTLSDDKLLPDLTDNIKQGNSLIEVDNIKRLKLPAPIWEQIAPFSWDFTNQYKGKSDMLVIANPSYSSNREVTEFHAIITNPPYVSTEDMKNSLPAQEVALYKKNYYSAYKQFDKYFLFIEKALDKLAPGGTLCFIIPNKFTKIASGKKLREMLTRYQFVSEFIDFGSAQLFKEKDITTYSSILVVKKEAQDTFEFEEVTDLQQWWANQDKPEKLNKATFSSDLIGGEPWVLVTDSAKVDLLNALYKDTYRLDEVANPVNGIQTSAEGKPYPAYWFLEEEIQIKDKLHFFINRNGKTYKIEKAILKPYFKPIKKAEKNAKTYDFVTPNKWMIFPYDANGKLFSQNVMKTTFPGAWNYLNDHFDRLVPRQVSGRPDDRDISDATADTWYKYGRTQHLKTFSNTPKLIVGVLRNEEPLYLYDEQDMLIASGGTAGYVAIIKKEGSPYDLEFIQAVLDHPAYRWLISIIGSDFEGDFQARGTSVLYGLPIKKIANKEEASMYQNIVEMTRRIYEINHEIQAPLGERKKNALDTEKKQLIQDIRDTVTKLYGIEHLLKLVH